LIKARDGLGLALALAASLAVACAGDPVPPRTPTAEPSSSQPAATATAPLTPEPSPTATPTPTLTPLSLSSPGPVANDPQVAGRWLLERPAERVRGISAVAPYGSSGYQSPDWVGFVGDGLPQAYPGLPGTWSGVAYDFVTGEGDSGQPGLPDEVAGCLAGS